MSNGLRARLRDLVRDIGESLLYGAAVSLLLIVGFLLMHASEARPLSLLGVVLAVYGLLILFHAMIESSREYGHVLAITIAVSFDAFTTGYGLGRGLEETGPLARQLIYTGWFAYFAFEALVLVALSEIVYNLALRAYGEEKARTLRDLTALVSSGIIALAVVTNEWVTRGFLEHVMSRGGKP